MSYSPFLTICPTPTARLSKNKRRYETRALSTPKIGAQLSGARRARVPAGRRPDRDGPVRPALVDGGAGEQAGALPGHVRDAIPTLNRTKRKESRKEGKRNKQTSRLTHSTTLTLPSPHRGQASSRPLSSNLLSALCIVAK